MHGGCVWFHSSRTSDTWPRHELRRRRTSSLFLSASFSSLDWHFKAGRRARLRRVAPRKRTQNTHPCRNPCRLVRRRVSATLQGKLTTFHDESLLSIETTLRQENHRCRIRTNDSIVSRLLTPSSLSLIESNNQTTIYMYIIHFHPRLFPFHFLRFTVFLSRITVN